MTVFLVICDDGTVYRVKAKYLRWTNEDRVVKLMDDIDTTSAVVSMANVRMVCREDASQGVGFDAEAFEFLVEKAIVRACGKGGCSCAAEEK